MNYRLQFIANFYFEINVTNYFGTILGVVIYKVINERMTPADGRVRCTQDSEAAGVTGFLYLPRPKSLAENQLYMNLYTSNSNNNDFLFDVSEVLPMTDPRTWVFSDGSPVSWFNWKSGEPNNYKGNGEHVVVVTTAGLWNDNSPSSSYVFMCTYHLPAGAEDICPWLQEFLP